MASLIVEGFDLVVKMSDLEKAEAVHIDIHVPLAKVHEVRAVEDAWPELRGIRAPGTGIPYVIAVGRAGLVRQGLRGRPRAGAAVVVDLKDADYSRLVVTTPDAEALPGLDAATSCRRSASPRQPLSTENLRRCRPSRRKWRHAR